MASGVTRSSHLHLSTTNGHAAPEDVDFYIDVADLAAQAVASGCECDVCEALRAADVTASANHRRYRSVTVMLAVGVTLVAIVAVITILDIFFNIT